MRTAVEEEGSAEIEPGGAVRRREAKGPVAMWSDRAMASECVFAGGGWWWWLW